MITMPVVWHHCLSFFTSRLLFLPPVSITVNRVSIQKTDIKRIIICSEFIPKRNLLYSNFWIGFSLSSLMHYRCYCTTANLIISCPTASKTPGKLGWVTWLRAPSRTKALPQLLTRLQAQIFSVSLPMESATAQKSFSTQGHCPSLDAASVGSGERGSVYKGQALYPKTSQLCSAISVAELLVGSAEAFIQIASQLDFPYLTLLPSSLFL